MGDKFASTSSGHEAKVAPCSPYKRATIAGLLLFITLICLYFQSCVYFQPSPDNQQAKTQRHHAQPRADHSSEQSNQDDQWKSSKSPPPPSPVAQEQANSGWLLFVPSASSDKWAASENNVVLSEQLGEEPGEGERADILATTATTTTMTTMKKKKDDMQRHNSTSESSSGEQGAELASRGAPVELRHREPSIMQTTSANSNQQAAAPKPAESFKNADSLEGRGEEAALNSSSNIGKPNETLPTRPKKLDRLRRRAGTSASERGRPILNEFTFPANLVQGMRFVLMCQVLDGEPPIQIKWFKDNLDLSALLQGQEGQRAGVGAAAAAVSGHQLAQSSGQSNQNGGGGGGGAANFPLDQVEMMSNDELGSSLLFRKVKQQHGGNYTCLASNHFGSSSYSSLMSVKVAPNWRLEPQDQESIMGEHITIDCQANGNPNPFIRWKFTSVQQDKTAQPLVAGDLLVAQKRRNGGDSLESNFAPLAQSQFKLINSNHHVQTLENGSLTIRQTGPEHEGLYMCEADNGVEPSLTKQIKLVVHRQAHFTDDIQVIVQQQQQQQSVEQLLSNQQQQQHLMQTSSNQVVSIKSIKLPQNSSLVRLVCRPRGEPPLQLDWLKDGRLIHTHSSNGPPSSSASLPLQLGNAIDHQPSAGQAAASLAQAGASGEQQHLSQTIGRYHVNTRWLTPPPPSMPMTAAASAAAVAAKFGPDGTNGLESELLLTNLARHDAGLYTCAARNAFGQAERKLRLIVQEQPEPPAMVDVAHISSRTISLRWLAPFDGNSAILKYVVEYRKLRNQAQLERDSSAPHNAGASSLAQELDAQHADTMPVGKSEKLMPIIAAGSTSTATLMTSLEQVQQQQQQQQQQQLQLTSGGAQLQHAVHDLEPMTRYSMRVIAFNALGASRPSVSLILRTEEEVPATVPNLVEASVLSSRSIKLRWTISYSLEHELIDGFFIGYRSFDSSLTASGGGGLLESTQASTNGDTAPGVGPAGGDTKLDRPTFTYKTIRLTNQQQQQDFSDGSQALRHHLHHHQSGGQPLLAPISSVTKSVPADTLANGVAQLGQQAIGSLSMGTTSHVGVQRQQQQQSGEVAFVISNFEYVISGLERNTEYTILIQCFNKKGAGPASDPATAKTLSSDPPEKLSLSVEDLSETSLRVQWQFRGETRPIDAPPLPPPGIVPGSQDPPVDGFVLTYAKVAPSQKSPDRPDMAARISQPNATTTTTTTTGNGKSMQDLNVDQMRQFAGGQYQPPIQPSQLLDHQWQAIQLAPQQRSHILKGLECGTWYAMKIWAFNKIGKGEPSDLVTASTRGKAPVAPDRRSFLAINSTQVKLHLSAWYDGGCELEKFIVQYRARGQRDWILVSNSILREQGNVIIRDLMPATAYELLVGAQNHKGQTEAKYRFSTLDAEGKQVVVSHSFLGGNLPTIDDDDNLVVDYTDDSGTQRELFSGSRGGGGGGSSSSSSEGATMFRWIMLVRQVLNSPLTLLMAFCLFLILLVLLVFHRLNANQSGGHSDRRFCPPSPSALNALGNNKSTLNNGSNNTGSGGRGCSLDGTATMMDCEPAMSMTNGSSLTESPARLGLNENGSGGVRINSASQNEASNYLAPQMTSCYNGAYCASAAGQANLMNHQQVVNSPARVDCTLDNYGVIQQQQQLNADYYSPSIYSGVHRSATMDTNTEQQQQQQHLMQMLLMSPQQQAQNAIQQGDTSLHLNQQQQLLHNDAANYSMAAAALTTLARQKAGMFRSQGGGAGHHHPHHVGPNMSHFGASATLGRHLVDSMHGRCEEATTFQAESVNQPNGITEAYPMISFSQQQQQCKQVRGLDLPISSPKEMVESSASSSMASTSGRGTNISSSPDGTNCNFDSTSANQQVRGLVQQGAPSTSGALIEDIEGESLIRKSQGSTQKTCDSKTRRAMGSQYDVPFKFDTTTPTGAS